MRCHQKHYKRHYGKVSDAPTGEYICTWKKRLLYTATKDLLSAFLGDKRSFEKPVLVTLLPGTNVKVIGFITKESLASWGMVNEVMAFIVSGGVSEKKW